MKCVPGCTCRKHGKRVHSAETRAKISASKMGHAVSAEARAKIGAASRGRVVNEETRARMRAASAGHGMRKTGAYRSWDGMIQRCTNPNASGWAAYGGAGITVCDRWREFTNFYEDMGDRPEGRSIDRIDNSRGYEPDNCRWATRSEQQRNRPNFKPDKRSKRAQ